MPRARHGYNIDGFSDYQVSTLVYYTKVATLLEANMIQQVEDHGDDSFDAEFFLWRQLTASMLQDKSKHQDLVYASLKSNLRLVNDDVSLFGEVD